MPAFGQYALGLKINGVQNNTCPKTGLNK